MISLHTLSQALEVHGYDSTVASPNIKGLKFNLMDAKSHRVLNRITVLARKYLQQYNNVPAVAAIISAMFKGKI